MRLEPAESAVLRCSQGARDRRDPLVGTAPPAHRWLLIEHEGPWARALLATPPLDGEIGAAIARASAAVRGRPMLVRRHGRRRSSGVRSWFAIDPRRGVWVRGQWSEPDDLYAAAEALGAPLTASDDPAELMLLVCAHGTRDVCCAVRGRSVASALAKRWPDATWESTHLGGDRFAGNVAVLPDGAFYGRLDAPLATLVVESHLLGEVRTESLRGLGTDAPVGQAAAAAALERFGPAAVHNLHVEQLTATGPDSWRVSLLGCGPMPERLTAAVVRSHREPALLTCSAVEPGSQAEFTVTDLAIG